MFKVCADSPAELIQYGGNIHQDVIGRERFERYYVPCFDEFAHVMHEAGKLSLCHMDAPMNSLAPALAETGMDVVEAFTPLPDGDMSVQDAREAWRDKVLWINFPSSMHLDRPEAIREETERILEEATPGDRFLIGITEDIPEDRWRASLAAILDAIRERGNLPLSKQ
jgi:uroporphyrinogen-III decarboxylase